jgi:hypothetical protein
LAEVLREIGVPQCSGGAPIPHILADEDRLVFAYMIESPDPRWDGTTVRIVAPDSPQHCAIVMADHYRAVTFGPPNDEAIHGHRLAPLGLRPYAGYEVLNSAWIAEMESANRVHSQHRPELFAADRHFIFTFHDSTLEFVAENFTVELKQGLIRLLLSESFADSTV